MSAFNIVNSLFLLFVCSVPVCQSYCPVFRLWSNFGEICFALRTSGSFRGGSCEGDGLASTCVVPTCVGKDRLLGVSGRTSVASSFAPTAETQDTRVIAHGA